MQTSQMKIAILQISDIHFRGATDLAATYLPKVGSVFNSLDYAEISTIIVILAGDTAYSGIKKEFDIATSNLIKLNDELLISKPGVSIRWICTPGNHDCDFSGKHTFRTLVINTLNDPNTKLSDPSVIDECLKPQANYREFSSNPIFEKPSKSHLGLVDEYFLRIDGSNVCIRTYNTAWISQVHEEPGKMSFPRSCMQESDEWARGDLNISVLHHPPHWLLPNRKRLMSQHLDQMSDLILYGHEHLPEQYIKSDFSGHTTGVVYGGVFQEDAHDVPGHFNVIVYDPSRYEFKLNNYCRNGGIFERASEDERWIPVRRLARTLGGRFEMSETFLDWLADAESDFSHPSGKKLSLEDLYVVPDLDEITEEDLKSKAPKLIKGENLLAELHKRERIIIYGDERSGKTTLSKFFFLKLLEEGLTPLYVNCSKLGVDFLKSPAKEIQHAFNRIYSSSAMFGFESLPKKQKVLLLDNFHQLSLNTIGRQKLLETLAQSFGMVVALGDRLMFLDEVSDGVLVQRGTDGFSRLRLREMGRYARRKLVRQWYSIGVEYSERGETISHRVSQAETTINHLFGKSFLPRLPVFVLGFLSNLDAVRQNKDIGTYGYIFESAITNSLLRGGTSIPMGIKYDFLANVAYYMHKGGVQSLSITELKAQYRMFSDEIGRDPGYSELSSEVIGTGMLVHHDDELRFHYQYVFNFFVARYFRDHLSDPLIRVELKELANSLNIERNANIWLFLVHQSKDEFLLGCILDVANSLFATNSPSKLEEDIDFIRDIQIEIPDLLKIPGSPTEDTLKSIYDESDGVENHDKKELSQDVNDDQGSHFIREVESMVRTVVVLGQLVKNFPALKADHKYSLVLAAFETSLRGLNAVMEQLNSGRDELAKMISEQVTKRQPGLQRPEIEGVVKGSLFWIFEANVFALIRLVSGAVGVIGEEATFEKVVRKLDSKSSKLISVSIGLDTLRIPQNVILRLKDTLKGDLFNQHLLRGLVANHLYLFPVKQSVRDEICEKLGIVVGDAEKRDKALGYRHKKE